MVRRSPPRPPDQASVAPSGRSEPSDIDPRSILRWAAGLVAGIILALVAVSVIFVAFLGHVPAVSIPPAGVTLGEATPTTIPPEPALESSPGETARFVEARENPVLDSYGWVDQKSGVARIPIRQAMAIIAQRGLPTRPAGTATAQDEGLTLPSSSSSGRYPEAILH